MYTKQIQIATLSQYSFVEISFTTSSVLESGWGMKKFDDNTKGPQHKTMSKSWWLRVKTWWLRVSIISEA